MSAVRMIPLGVGEAFPARHYTTCLVLGVDDTWLLIECPHPVRKMLREATAEAGLPFDLDRIEGVAVSHLHADHCSGLEGFIYYQHYAAGKRARVYAAPAVSASLWPGHLAAGMEWSVQEPGHAPVHRRPEEFFDLVPLEELGEVQVGPFSLSCRRTAHSVPTTALRVRAGGRCLGYSADTAFDPGLIDWLSAADLIIHETGGGGLHTPYEKLAALPAELRARMRLIHYPDDFDAAASAIQVLRQGRRYEV